MSISVQILCGLIIRKDLTTGVENVTNPSAPVISVGGSTSLSDSGTTPDAELGGGPRIALVAGAKTIDLTSVPDMNGGTVNGTGKKPRAIFFENLAANSGSITITAGAAAAANGNDALGTTFTKVLRPGERFCCQIADTGPTAISGTNKNIDVAGTGAESFNFGVAFG